MSQRPQHWVESSPPKTSNGREVDGRWTGHYLGWKRVVGCRQAGNIFSLSRSAGHEASVADCPTLRSGVRAAVSRMEVSMSGDAVLLRLACGWLSPRQTVHHSSGYVCHHGYGYGCTVRLQCTPTVRPSRTRLGDKSMSPGRGFGTSCLLHCGHLTVSANFTYLRTWETDRVITVSWLWNWRMTITKQNSIIVRSHHHMGSEFRREGLCTWHHRVITNGSRSYALITDVVEAAKTR